MQSPIPRPFGSVTLREKFHVLGTVLGLPAVLLWNIVTKPLVPHNREKRWKRVLIDTTLTTAFTGFNRVELQYILGPSRPIIEKWATKAKTPIEVEDIGEDARLIWIGPKKTDKVILYLHGGAFSLSLQKPCLDFWKYILTELKRRGQDVGFAMLEYTLFPNATFPTPLRQAVRALEHLRSSGMQVQNLQITGDSAGGNLVIQLLSHILHPLDNVPQVNLSAPILGAYPLSPWTRLIVPSGNRYDGIDTLNSKKTTDWGSEILQDVPESHNVYLEAANASPTWFAGIDKVVSRVLITAGGNEMLVDDIIQFNDLFAKHHKDVKFVIQNGGVHDDPFNDFFFGERNPVVGVLTPLIIDWFFDGFD